MVKLVLSGRDNQGRFTKGHRIRKPTARQKAKQLAHAAEMGRLSALKQVEKSKGATQTIKESIIQWIKTIDPLEVTAIGGLTLIVHNFMINTPKILEGISNTLNLLAIPVPILPLLELTGLVPKNLGADQWKEILKNNEVIVWLVAFSLAYVMVRHAGALIGLVNGGIDKIVPFLLGIT